MTAGRARSRSFITRGRADSYRAEVIRAARKGLDFTRARRTGVLGHVRPRHHSLAGPRSCLRCDEMPLAAAHTRAGIADALATITPALLTPGPGRPLAAVLRTALYGHAFNAARAGTDPGPAATAALGWLRHRCLPLAALADPAVTRRALDAPGPAPGWDPGRGHDHHPQACRLPRLPQPRGRTRTPGSRPTGPHQLATARDRPARQARGQRPPLLRCRRSWPRSPVSRPELTAFFGCLYYAALRPPKPSRCVPAPAPSPHAAGGSSCTHGIFPRSARAWTGNGTPREPRGLKHRPEGAIRTVPIPPQLRPAPLAPAGFRVRRDGRLFQAPAAARSAKASTAGSGTRPAPQPWPAGWDRHPSPAFAPTTFAMPRCRCGWPPAPRPPRSLPAPGTACASCSPSTPTAYPAATRSPASTSSRPSAPASGPPLAHKNRRRRQESCPSCVRATAGLNGTQLDLTPPPRSG